MNPTDEDVARMSAVREKILSSYWFKKSHSGSVKDAAGVDMVFSRLLYKLIKDDWPIMKLAKMEREKTRNELNKFIEYGYCFRDLKFLFGSEKCIFLLKGAHELFDGNIDKQKEVELELWKMYTYHDNGSGE